MTIPMTPEAGGAAHPLIDGTSTISSFDARAAYTVLRLSFGLAMFMHGLARFIGGLDAYAKPQITGFDNVALPHTLVVFVIYAIPYIEVIFGALVLFGFLTLVGLLGNAALMLLLIFGTSMQQRWGGVALQLSYVLIIALLLLGRSLNGVALDSLLAKRGLAA